MTLALILGAALLGVELVASPVSGWHQQRRLRLPILAVLEDGPEEVHYLAEALRRRGVRVRSDAELYFCVRVYAMDGLVERVPGFLRYAERGHRTRVFWRLTPKGRALLKGGAS